MGNHAGYCPTVELSTLGHTWIVDLDGTIVQHNAYKNLGHDVLLEGAKAFMASIPSDDLVIIVTSRTEEYRETTLRFLYDNGIAFDHIVFGAPYGERVVVNDIKPGGLKTAIALNVARDAGFPEELVKYRDDL